MIRVLRVLQASNSLGPFPRTDGIERNAGCDPGFSPVTKIKDPPSLFPKKRDVWYEKGFWNLECFCVSRVWRFLLLKGVKSEDLRKKTHLAGGLEMQIPRSCLANTKWNHLIANSTPQMGALQLLNNI